VGLLVRLGVITAVIPSVAPAHIKLLEPLSTWSTENGGKGKPPCGEGIPSTIITKARGGHPLTVRVQEFIPHPGHYRIALSTKSRDELPVDPVVEMVDNKSVSAAIAENPQPPILADGVFPHTTTPRNTEWKMDVMLPNLSCEKCTLQVIQFMANHPGHADGVYYHSCADLEITADPSLPPAGDAWMVPAK